jgi:putative ABC transport system permease protein
VFGSMANKINALVAGGTEYFQGKVSVSDSSSQMGGFAAAPMAISTADQVRGIDGVAAVVPGITLLVDDQAGGMTMSMPPMIEGSVAGADLGHETWILKYAQGRALTAEDEGRNVAVLGSDLARRYGKSAGDTIALRGVDFQVVGVLEPTLTAPDQAVMVPLHAAQSLFVASLPPVIRQSLPTTDVMTSMTVYPVTGVDPEVVADRVEAVVPHVTAMTAKDFDREIGSSMSILNAILIGIGMISLVVGGLSVTNTMAMSIAERTREIGIKRAIGGTRIRIVRELVVEAALIGFIGGAIGLVLGWLLVTLGNDAGRASGNVLFDLTTGTAIGAVLFSTVLGAIAGFLPAVRAARLDPVTALRYE